MKAKDSLYKALLDEVTEIVKILKVKYKPEKIILFGSLADGRGDEASDIDLVILT
jgi:predicted nucleotidyltransferase